MTAPARLRRLVLAWLDEDCDQLDQMLCQASRDDTAALVLDLAALTAELNELVVTITERMAVEQKPTTVDELATHPAVWVLPPPGLEE